MLDYKKIATTEADTAQEIGLKLQLMIAHSGALYIFCSLTCQNFQCSSSSARPGSSTSTPTSTMSLQLEKAVRHHHHLARYVTDTFFAALIARYDLKWSKGGGEGEGVYSSAPLELRLDHFSSQTLRRSYETTFGPGDSGGGSGGGEALRRVR